jgi:hypothetical protein
MNTHIFEELRNQLFSSPDSMLRKSATNCAKLQSAFKQVISRLGFDILATEASHGYFATDILRINRRLGRVGDGSAPG